MVTSVASRYEIVEKIGEGGSGVVYKARDLHVPRFVALKFIYPELLSSEHAVCRFKQEARTISGLNHPNIVVLHDLDTDPKTGRLFLVLEFLGGGTLRDRIGQGSESGAPFPPLELLRCATATAAALSHAHRHKVIHRDVKPSNVMFSEDRIVKLTDFGIAKSDGAVEITEPGRTPGTISYMSPEQARGLELDHRTDVFSFGIVLYEMATGRLPFTGRTPYEVLDKIVTEPLPRIDCAAGIPAELERIIQRATAKEPSERYGEMEELETELLALQLRLQNLSAQPTSAIAPAPKRPLRHRAAAALVCALVLLLALAGIVWMRNGRPGTAAPKTARLLAVLPFSCLGHAGGQPDFCEGLANTLSAKFTQMEPFQDRVLVVPYSEVRREGITTAAEARKVFQVQLALAGSVEFTGTDVRVLLNLVDAAKNVQTASRVLDSPATNLIALQDATSAAAGSMLQLRLDAAGRQRVAAGETRNDAAFEAYVRGLGHLSSSDIEDTGPAIALLEKATALDPSYAIAHARLGEAYLRQFRNTEDGRWLDRARASCERALKLDSRLADGHISMAKVWLARTDAQKAVQELNVALSVEPKNAEALRMLGNAYAELGRRDPARKTQAVETLKAAIALRPELWTTYRDLGLAYHKLGDNQKAEQQFLLMLEFTKSADAYSRLGALYHLMDRPSEALTYLQKSIAIKPTPEAYANLGTVCYYLGRYPEQIEYSENALRLSNELRTTNHVIWGNLAIAYGHTAGMEAKSRNAFHQAIRIAETKLRASPADAPAHASLAYYYVRTGENGKALREVQKALALAPDAPSVLFRCSLVYERLKRREQALESVQRAIERGHPMKEVLNAGDLQALRQDPRFQERLTSKAGS